jgi:phage terminase large subunit
MQQPQAKEISVRQLIGGGYDEFWKCRKRYLVVKGSRASKKSKTTALRWVVLLMQYPTSNLLCVRKVFSTLHDSCYSDIKWAVNRIGVQDYWSFKESPLEITYKPTGQKVLFRGLDDAQKINSITVPTGSLNFLWCEECYEISDEASFQMLDECIRGEIAEGLFKQIVCTFNPWSDKSWLKKRFFDEPHEDVLAITTNYMCNEWLDDADRKVFENMKKQNPRRYRIAGLGEWGVSEGLIFENFEERDFKIDDIRKKKNIKAAFGCDLGWTDPTAFVACMIDDENKEIFVFDEWYKENVTNEDIYNAIWEMGYANQYIIFDSAEPKSIQELRNYGLYKAKPARKGRDSVLFGIQLLQQYKIIVKPSCINVLREINNYSWETDKSGKTINRPDHTFSHSMDALRYAVMDKVKGSSFSFE